MTPEVRRGSADAPFPVCTFSCIATHAVLYDLFYVNSTPPCASPGPAFPLGRLLGGRPRRLTVAQLLLSLQNSGLGFASCCPTPGKRCPVSPRCGPAVPPAPWFPQQTSPGPLLCQTPCRTLDLSLTRAPALAQPCREGPKGRLQRGVQFRNPGRGRGSDRAALLAVLHDTCGFSWILE